ncbi:MAG: DUF983 domain-containing protein [Bacteroidetes bacterium]|nr:DUF983 domain-containing protein [Bacteroidota bacterium]
MTSEKASRSYLTSVFNCRCPRCREGKLFQYPARPFRFKRSMQMNKNCTVCNQVTELEVGFYYGTSFVSYTLGILISVFSLILWFITVGISINDNRFFYWLAANSILLLLIQPWIMQLSRSFWISWFVKYDPNWKTNKPKDFLERQNSEQANNW